jgi:hypothetical protein
MSATLIAPTAPASAPNSAHACLRNKMLAAGWSPDEIRVVQRALIAARIHDTYLRAGYSPDDIARIVSLY